MYSSTAELMDSVVSNLSVLATKVNTQHLTNPA
jgi:hypothetical protein